MSRRRLIVASAAAVVVLALVTGAVAWRTLHSSVADIHNGASLPFSAPSTTTPEPVTEASQETQSFGPPWPVYGRVPARTRDASDLRTIKPPYGQVWKRNLRGLLEFPPSYSNGVLYLGLDAGAVLAMNVRTGKVLWRKRFAPVPDQPAIWRDLVIFGTFDKPGSVTALDAKTGRLRWRTRLTDQVESSMVVYGGKVFTGCNDGTVRALDALTGKVIWKFDAGGAVKASIAVDDGRVFFGAYGGTMYSLRARDGHKLWNTHTAGLSGGYRSGNFYSSPAVAYGRVYVGNTDGKVYSFVASTGQIAWTSTMPDWAYGSPGTGFGKVFATSYDGTFAAMDARTGKRLWTHKLPYRSLSSAVVIGSLVYVADMGAKQAPGHTYAYDPTTGRQVWKFADGEYHGPIAADGKLIVPGFTKLYALKPRDAR
jgi:outer membrane protein assembly factor BamB